MRRRFRPQPRRENKNPHNINENIKAREVRLVGDNVEMGVYPISKARELANELELDLVEISPNAEPPVCKIIDYKKFLYEQKKRDKALKAKATKVVVKEIRFGPQTDDHDYDFKKRHAEKFLKEGAKLKAYVFFKGRSIVYKDQGEILLLKLAQELEELGKVEQMPKLEGKRMTMFIAPKTNKK
ncbi:translation initiation factor IF-3 [Allomuricauda sp. NBRC 101325]|uniref:translation initiation factor IF-3 n=1 Tax=Allomuricauda sp. NBRC 101325 TaxID=1113758 RepID=UPI002555ABDB|nr:translation initiation factor IF-3 [Muricauda sp. NBRC 101325]